MKTTIAQRQLAAIARTPDHYLVDLLSDGADGGIGWYDRACDDLSQFAGVFPGTTLNEVSAVTAILSPRCSVRRNCIMSAEFFITGGQRPTGSMQQRWDSIREYYTFGNVGSTSALKIKNFARALGGDKNAIVNDTWIASIFGLDYGKHGLSELPYAAISERIARLARRFSLSNCDTQAALWVGKRLEVGAQHDGDAIADLSLTEFLPAVVA
jgi:hypothetical protein